VTDGRKPIGEFVLGLGPGESYGLDRMIAALAVAVSVALPIGIVALAYDFPHHPATGTGGAVLATLVIACAGIAIERAYQRARFAQVRALFPLFLIKLLVTMLLLDAFWMPVFRDEPNALTGEDASRFHYISADLAGQDFDFSVIQDLNYTGAPFYYGVLYRLIGINQLFPAMLNALGSLLVGLIFLLIAVDLRLGHQAWLLGLYMLLPDVIYSDVLTSKESPAVLFFVIAYASVYAWHMRRSVLCLLAAVLAWIALAWIRPPAALVFLGVVFVVLILDVGPARRWWMGIVGVVIVASGLSAVLLIERVTDARGTDALSLTWSMLTAGGDLGKFQALEWADRSLGRQLLPETAWQAVVYTPIRAALYWISPLAAFDLAWSIVLRGMTAALVLVNLPAIVAALFDTRIRRSSAFLWLGLPFFLVTLMTAGGTWVIYDRYRVAALPFLPPLLMLGYRSRFISSLVWVAPVVLIVIFIGYEILKH
jgi:hypothetical protein